jgi:hypothetical protein
MKTENTTAKNADARETRAEKAIRLLQTTAIDPLQLKLQEFRAFYPAVATARHKGMKTKQILKLLAEGGLKLYPGLLEKLMVAIEKAKGAPSCELCGQTLRKEAAEPVSGSPLPVAEGELPADLTNEGEHTSDSVVEDGHPVNPSTDGEHPRNSPANLIEKALALHA